MEKRECEELFADTSIIMDKNTKMQSWKPLLRQSVICVGVWCTYLVQGLYLGAPTVMIAQIRGEENSTQIVTDEMLSWITSAPIMSAIPYIIILPWLLNKIGRKFCFAILWLFIIIGVIVFYMSTNLYQVLISEMCLGSTSGAIVTFTPVLIAEYTSPKYRGIFLTLKSATSFWGIWISNAIGTFSHWKNIAIVPVMCSIYIMITVMIWPESPYWLARKGRYEESAKSQRWLKGLNEKSEKELVQLANVAKDGSKLKEIRGFSSISEFWSTITLRSFYKPTLIGLILHAQYLFSGKLVISMYAIEVIKRLVTEESLVYKQMLILDGITVVSMYAGCILSRYFKRRTLLLTFSCTAIALLYILSFYIYLVNLSILKENYIIILLLLSAFSIAIGCGPMILSTAICGEIIPLRYQHTSMILVGLGAITTLSTLLKLSPLMFKAFKMHGYFLVFAINSTIFLSILYVYLPETKDKTIQEIENYFTENQSGAENDDL